MSARSAAAILVVEAPGDFEALSRAGAIGAEDRCLLLDAGLRSELPVDWPARRLLDFGQIARPELEARAAARARIIEAMISADAAGRAEICARIRLVLLRRSQVEAAAALPGDKRFAAPANLRAGDVALALARPGAYFMALHPDFLPVRTAPPLAASGETLPPGERGHPYFALLRQLAASASGALAEPVLPGGPASGEMTEPGMGLRAGRWPNIRQTPPPTEGDAATPGLDAIVPVHNAAQTIAATADSILAGIDRNDRLILVENGSTDDSWERINRRYAGAPNVVLDRLAAADPAAARNRAIELGANPYIAFCDADDLWAPVKPAIVKQTLARTGADILLHPCLTLDGGYPRLEGNGFAARGLPRRSTSLAELLIAGNFVATSSLVLRRATLPLPLFAPGLLKVQDYEAWCRWAKHNPRPVLAWVDEPLGFYRKHMRGISRHVGERQIIGAMIARRYAHNLGLAERCLALGYAPIRVYRHTRGERGRLGLALRAIFETPLPTIRG